VTGHDIMDERLRLWAATMARCVRHAPGLSVLFTLLLAAESVAVALVAVCVRSIVDSASRDDIPDLVAAASAAGVCLALMVGGMSTRYSLRGNLSERVGLFLGEQILEMVTGLRSLDHLDRPEHLDKMSRLMAGGVTGGGPSLVTAAWAPVESAFSVFGLGASLALLAEVHPALLLLIVAAPGALLVNRKAQAKTLIALSLSAEPERREEHLFDLLVSASAGKEIRIHGAKEKLSRLRTEAWERSSTILFRARLHSAVLTSCGWLFFTACYCAGLGYIAFLVVGGERGAGDFLLAVTLIGQLRRQVERVVTGLDGAMTGSAALEPYMWLVRRWRREQARRADHVGVGQPPSLLVRGITLSKVSFHYPRADRDAVSQLSVFLPAGSTVAVIGEYGSGKTSLVKLLCGFYEPQQGSITIDDLDLRTLDLEAWHDRLSMTFQDFARYQTSVRTGVGIGDRSRANDPEAIAEAVRTGGARGVVTHLANGLDTDVGAEFGGKDLSDGEWQKVALARSAMRTTPLLLILDEPTAALDAPSERAVFARQQARARELARSHGTITLLVTHRLSTVPDADFVLVMRSGQLIEFGSPSILRQRGGHYAELLKVHERLRPPDVTTPTA